MTYPNGVQALKPTDLDLADGEATVLLGPSGAEKSTLLRSLNLLVTPTGGEIHARDVGALASRAQVREHRRGAAIIFQQHQLIIRMPALQISIDRSTGRAAAPQQFTGRAAPLAVTRCRQSESLRSSGTLLWLLRFSPASRSASA